MGAPVGSSIFFVFALLTITLFVLLLLRYYLPLRTSPSYVVVPVFLALALPASIVFIVPIDIGSVQLETDSEHEAIHHGIWLPQRALLVAWRITYWLTFVLTWFALPLIGEYADSGYRQPKDRFLYSLRSNGRYQAIVLGSSALAAVYFFLTEGFKFQSLKGTVMALAYAWGLLLAIYLMGHGFVALPKKLFRDASVDRRLRAIQAQAPKVNDKLLDATEELIQYQKQVAQLQQKRNGTAREFGDWIDELVDMAGNAVASGSATRLNTSAAVTVPNVITDRFLADLTRRLKRARHARLRYASEWDYLITSAQRAKLIHEARTSMKLSFPPAGPHSPLYRRLNILTPSLRYILHAYVIPACSYLLSLTLALASIAVIWSELVKSSAPHLSLINLSVLHNKTDVPPSFISQLLAGLWLLYMCAAALHSVTAVKVWGNRALVRRGTYPESATWYAGQVAKLTVPLSYNFVTMLDPSVREKTIFYQFLGTLVDLTPLGKGFSAFFPIVVLLPVLAATFGLYGRVQRGFGFGDLMDDEDAKSGEYSGWREGAVLIDRELKARGDADGVGLLSTPRASMDTSLEAGTRRSAEYHAPYSDHPQGPLVIDRAESARARARPALEPVDEEENFFERFGRRVKNTFDSTERPAFLDGITEGFKKPKWMGGDESSGSAGRSEGGGLGGFFGRVKDGQLRLG